MNLLFNVKHRTKKVKSSTSYQGLLSSDFVPVIDGRFMGNFNLVLNLYIHSQFYPKLISLINYVLKWFFFSIKFDKELININTFGLMCVFMY
jgi:hypothetical protein